MYISGQLAVQLSLQICSSSSVSRCVVTYVRSSIASLFSCFGGRVAYRPQRESVYFHVWAKGVCVCVCVFHLAVLVLSDVV